MPSSEVDTEVVRIRALAEADAEAAGADAEAQADAEAETVAASWTEVPPRFWPSSLSGGDEDPELQDADEELPGLEPNHLSVRKKNVVNALML